MVEVEQSESRLPHAIAVVLVCATFPLIFVGGLVTTYEAGMAVPDWPTSYGYNLFLYPKWASGPWDLFVEHGHRLLGATVGLITIAAVVAVWVRDSRRWLKIYSVMMLLAVCAQGALGGLRVRLDERVVAKVHACTSPLFFAMTVALAAFTSRRWMSSSPSQIHEQGNKLRVLAFATAAIAWLQIVMGARLRHVSIEQPPHEFGDAVFWHLLIAAVLVIHIILLTVRVARSYRDMPEFVRPVVGLVTLIVCQLALGASTWVVNYGWPAWFQNHDWAERHVIVQESLGQAVITTAHVAIGSLILVTAVLIALRSFRFVHGPAGSLAWRATTTMGVAA